MTAPVPMRLIATDHGWRLIPDSEWERLNEWALQSLEVWQDDYSRGRRWSRHGELGQRLLGLIGEWLYRELIGMPQPTKLRDTYDGGQDFPGVDVKATGYWQTPWILRMGTDPLKAPFYASVAVDLRNHECRLAGYATRHMLIDAELVEYGHGLTRTVKDLLTSDELLDTVFRGAT